jgi:hypothetical protein
MVQTVRARGPKSSSRQVGMGAALGLARTPSLMAAVPDDARRVKGAILYIGRKFRKQLLS